MPTLDGVAFIDPRRSEVDVVQAVGRAIRKSPDKKIGSVVLPAFIKQGDDPESSAFKHVWEVLKALRAHDEQLAEELDELRREMGYRRISGRRPGKIQLLLPVGVISLGPSIRASLNTRPQPRSSPSASSRASLTARDTLAPRPSTSKMASPSAAG